MPDFASLKVKVLLFKGKLRSFWKNLTSAQKASLVSLLAFVLILPLGMVAVLSPTRPFLRAQLPATPPVTPTPTPTPYCPARRVNLLSPTDGQIFPRTTDNILFSWEPAPIVTGYSLYYQLIIGKKIDSDWQAVFKTGDRLSTTKLSIEVGKTSGVVRGENYIWFVYSVAVKDGKTICKLPSPQRSFTIQNASPVIITTELPVGYVGQKYEARVRGYDPNEEDTLTMTITNLPPGLSQGTCTTWVSTDKRKIIRCEIVGKPTRAGTAKVKITLKDDTGSTATKTLPLAIKCPAGKVCTTF